MNDSRFCILVTRHRTPNHQIHVMSYRAHNTFSTWTTEKEINFFIDWNLSGPITQSIRGNVLNNNIPFKSGGGLGVEGSVSIPDEENNGDIDCQNRQRRTNFKFTSAVLDLDKWGKYNFPPVGEGWFDTVYLDEDLRVDINSRNDILVCTPLEI
mmetsp:Transcript_2653/g.3480  ORF Transcript_2653/g.3480 Transcript_2653/m.3480 type:complete len:154 (-) Transcript_2653:150-611(-)